MKLINLVEAATKDIQKVDKKHSVLQLKARKLLIGFFIMMFVLTIISKAADSVTIAQVTTCNPRAGNLTFQIEGSGTITAGAKKYVKVQEGIGIDKINLQVGQKVKKGELILTLDKADVKKAFASAKSEADKLKNQIEQEKLADDGSSLTAKQKAELLYHGSKVDLSDAKSELKDAKEAYKDAVEKEKKAELSYNKTLTNSADEILNQKQEEYQEAKASFDSVSEENKNSFNRASRDVNNASKVLQELKNIDNNISGNVTAYCNYYGKDSQKTMEALNGLLQLAYEDSNIYETHNEQLDSLYKKVSRANEDLTTAQNAYNKAASAKDITEEQLANYKNSLVSARRTLEDAQDELSKCSSKENKIKGELNQYKTATTNNDAGKKDSALSEINKCIFGISGYTKHINEVAEAQEKLEEAKADLEAVKKKNELSLILEEKKREKIKKTLDQISKGTYDNKEAVQSEKLNWDTARQEAETKKEKLSVAQKAVETAKRSVETSELDYSQAKQQGVLNIEAINLKIASIQLDLKAKQEAVYELEALQNNKGKIYAPVAGTIENISFEEGKGSVADHSVVIDTGSFGVLIKVPKEEGEYVSAGDEISLTMKGKRDKITANVEEVRFTTAVQAATEQTNKTEETGLADLAEITAVLPEGEYIPGATLDASIIKNSELYDNCVPINAIRSDGQEDFCYITNSKNTVLGNQLLVTRVGVRVNEKDRTMAAVEASLSNEDNVIISSNKEIKEGDRVRLQQ